MEWKWLKQKQWDSLSLLPAKLDSGQTFKDTHHQIFCVRDKKMNYRRKFFKKDSLSSFQFSSTMATTTDDSGFTDDGLSNFNLESTSTFNNNSISNLLEFSAHEHKLDQLFGYERINDSSTEETRTGWLINMHPVLRYVRRYSHLHLFLHRKSRGFSY